jgi:8-oxo-dGTP diphosphatase
MRVVGCFLQYKGKFVILLRHSHKPDGNTWGLPSGKVEPGESDRDAIMRELHEETGYQASSSEVKLLGEFQFISSEGQPFIYVTHRVILPSLHTVQLETHAHAAYKWVTPKECDAMPDLIFGLHELLRLAGYIK